MVSHNFLRVLNANFNLFIQSSFEDQMLDKVSSARCDKESQTADVDLSSHLSGLLSLFV